MFLFPCLLNSPDTIYGATFVKIAPGYYWILENSSKDYQVIVSTTLIVIESGTFLLNIFTSYRLIRQRKHRTNGSKKNLKNSNDLKFHAINMFMFFMEMIVVAMQLFLHITTTIAESEVHSWLLFNMFVVAITVNDLTSLLPLWLMAYLSNEFRSVIFGRKAKSEKKTPSISMQIQPTNTAF
ncbi:unnamed protein product, partial [Mesorhabditis belari]|uniref:Uncharacterized protein n=1 Tax=Mesorhabditis belari TaxID=2138241 RepID=A0AAF3EJT4_9BILA